LGSLKSYHTSNGDEKEEFRIACGSRNLDEIRRLAPHFDLNTTRFEDIMWKPSPIVYSMGDKGEMEAIDLLLELGAIIRPFEAYFIERNIMMDDMPKSYYDSFRERGYDIKKLAEEYDFSEPTGFSSSDESDSEEGRWRDKEKYTTSMEQVRDELGDACYHNDIENIRWMAEIFDLNTTRFDNKGRPSPIILCLRGSESLEEATETLDVLLELGVIPKPFDASYVKYFIIKYECDELYDYFKEKGYDIKQLADQYDDKEREKEEKAEREYRIRVQKFRERIQDKSWWEIQRAKKKKEQREQRKREKCSDVIKEEE
jgi:hypothetical protein